MELFVVLPSLLAILGLALIAWDARNTDKRPPMVLLGMLLVTVAVGLRLFTGEGSLGTFASVLIDIGLGLLVAALLLVAKRSGAKAFLGLAVLSLGLGGALIWGNALFNDADDADAETMLVELGPDDTISEIAAVLDRHEVTYERAFPTITLQADEDLAQYYLIAGSRDALAAVMDVLRQDRENVDHIEWNRTIALVEPVEVNEIDAERDVQAIANDPLVNSQWAMKAINGHATHRLLKSLTPAKKAKVAIIDTGVDAKHPDIKDVFIKTSPATTDKHGHGSHCAGIAGAATHNGVGIASLNWNGAFVEVAGYKALTDVGSGTIEMVAQSVIDATQDGVDVISMSLGDVAPVPPKVLVDAVEFAQGKGVIVVASAGNSNQDAYNHIPSNLDGVISVAAVGPDLKKASFSNYMPTLTRPIAAPGVRILSLQANGKYVEKSGTSMSAPMVSGLLGVMRALNPDLSATDAYQILNNTGTVTAEAQEIGHVINAEAAIQAVLQAQ